MRRRRHHLNPFLDPSFRGFDDVVWERAMASVLAQQASSTPSSSSASRRPLFGGGFVLASVAILALATFRPGVSGSAIGNDTSYVVAAASMPEERSAHSVDESMTTPQTAALRPVGSAQRDLRGRVFAGAILRNKDLRGLDFTDSVFSDAVLAGSNLSGAHLRGHDLSVVDLTDAEILKPVRPGSNPSGSAPASANLAGSGRAVPERIDPILLSTGFVGAGRPTPRSE